MEQMMATVLPFYLAEPDKPEIAARLATMSAAMKANQAAGQAWGKGLYLLSYTILVAGPLTSRACPS
jgi:hypothetical protein